MENDLKTVKYVLEFLVRTTDTEILSGEWPIVITDSAKGDGQ